MPTLCSVFFFHNFYYFFIRVEFFFYIYTNFILKYLFIQYSQLILSVISSLSLLLLLFIFKTYVLLCSDGQSNWYVLMSISAWNCCSCSKCGTCNVQNDALYVSWTLIRRVSWELVKPWWCILICKIICEVSKSHLISVS